MTNSSSPTSSRRSLVALAALLSVMSAEGRTYGSVIAPRNYHFSRTQDPFDGLVRDIFNMPIYFNSLIKQHDSAVEKRDHSWTPHYDISEDPETGCMELTMEVPGMTAKDFEIELENESLLQIKGSRTVKRNGKVLKTSFQESFQLDKDADPEQLEVSLSAGILQVRAPKKEKIIKKIPVVATEEDEDLTNSHLLADAGSDADEKPKNEEAEIVDELEITTSSDEK